MTGDTMNLELEPRTVIGKAVKHLRKDGYVPAVIHDHGKASIVVQVQYQPLRQLYLKAGKHHPVNLKAGSHSYTALIKSVTFEPRKHLMTHVVFNAVKRNQKVETEIPVRPRYAEGNEESPAERAGLIVLTQLDSVAVRAVPDKLPDVLEYDAEKLIAEGDQVTVADLVIPDGVELLAMPEQTIATAESSAALQADNAAAGGTTEQPTETKTPEASTGDESKTEVSGSSEAE